MIDSRMADVAARLSAHEFLIEVLFAQMLADCDPGMADRIIADIRELSGRGRLPPRSGPVDVADLEVLEARMREVIGRFLEKADERSRQIRQAREVLGR